MACGVLGYRTPAGVTPPGNCRSSRYVELGRKTLAAQYVWRNLILMAPVRDGQRDSYRAKVHLVAAYCGRSGLPDCGAFGLEIGRSRNPSGAWPVVACPPCVASAAVVGLFPDSGPGTPRGALCRGCRQRSLRSPASSEARP